MSRLLLLFISILIFSGCQNQESNESLHDLISSQTPLHGNESYRDSPYVTAGDRVYAVGHQNGTFPDLGWHVTGEMGGIWDHPIKLLDGFTFGISMNSRYYCLDNAYQFSNYPIGSLFKYQASEDLEITQTQFVPDGKEGMVVEYELVNRSDEAIDLVVDFTGMTDLRPVWLADSLDLQDGLDIAEFNRSNNTWTAKDSLNDWHLIFGTDYLIKGWAKPKSQCSYERKGKGTDLMIQSELALEPGQRISLRYFIAGSYHNQENAAATYKHLKADFRSLFLEKLKRYEAIKSSSAINVPDQEIQTMYEWTKYNTDWLIRDVPEIGRGLSAGLPDYPWWFGTDNCYTLQGLLATGQHDEVKHTLQTILKLSKATNENGRIIHEASTNGIVYNPGNLNTTPHFIYLIWKYYLWTGDKSMLEQNYEYIKSGIRWIIESQDKDQNGFPDGAGMMEIHGLHSEMIDVVVYTQAALEAASNIAAALNDEATATQYMNQAIELKRKINNEWWVEDANSYADFRATKEETLKLIDAAIIRADTIQKPWAVEELAQMKNAIQNRRIEGTSGFVVHHNWVVNTPTEMGIADTDKAIKALNSASQYTNPFGVYVTGIDRDENKSNAEKWKSFSYVGAVMTLPTGVQAISEARYGRVNKSLDYLKMLENGFSYAFPGSMYEVSPDYGMITQAWTIYAVATPIVEYYFGIQPNAPKRKVTIQPNLPEVWPEASIEHVKIGDNSISVAINPEGYIIMQDLAWEIIVELPQNKTDVMLNGRQVNASEISISSSEKTIELSF